MPGLFSRPGSDVRPLSLPPAGSPTINRSSEVIEWRKIPEQAGSLRYMAYLKAAQKLPKGRTTAESSKVAESREPAHFTQSPEYLKSVDELWSSPAVPGDSWPAGAAQNTPVKRGANEANFQTTDVTPESKLSIVIKSLGEMMESNQEMQEPDKRVGDSDTVDMQATQLTGPPVEIAPSPKEMSDLLIPSIEISPSSKAKKRPAPSTQDSSEVKRRGQVGEPLEPPKFEGMGSEDELTDDEGSETGDAWGDETYVVV